ncbi:MAG: hypothetical protein MUP18_01830 [Desulfobacterales bacterium]|nr:hypothetical protein [Desulfobacterales bacterium]
MVRRAYHESPLSMSKGHPSPSQRLSEPAATFILPPAYRRAGIKGGGDFVGEFIYL